MATMTPGRWINLVAAVLGAIGAIVLFDGSFAYEGFPQHYSRDGKAEGADRRWLDELLSDPRLTFESLASREGRTVRSIRMTLSLAFLAPEIVKAAVEGRLPRGFGLKRLVDLPMAWPDQWRTLGLQAPA